VSSSLADLSTSEVAELVAAGAILAVPVGSTEQHGAHLPLSTDTDIAIALCDALASERPDIVVAPPVPYGSSGEHAGFAGTLSIGQEATELLMLELGRSATDTFAHVLIVSAHGGNSEPAARAVARLEYEGRDVSLYQPRWHGDTHAGHVETSLQLLLRPDAVRPELAIVGDVRPLTELLPLLRAGGVRSVTATGVLGDPRSATAEAGRAMLAALTADLLAHVASWLGT
jgi:mycofactocin system creatininase family protein